MSFLVQAAETAKEMLGKALAGQPDETPLTAEDDLPADEQPIAAIEEDEMAPTEDEEPA